MSMLYAEIKPRDMSILLLPVFISTADDFQTNPIEVTFDPSADTFMDVVIQIPQDSTNEADEDFVVVLELVDAINPGVVFGRMASIVRIRDDDREFT